MPRFKFFLKLFKVMIRGKHTVNDSALNTSYSSFDASGSDRFEVLRWEGR